MVGEKEDERVMNTSWSCEDEISSSHRYPIAPVIVLEYDGTRRGWLCEKSIKKGGTTLDKTFVL